MRRNSCLSMVAALAISPALLLQARAQTHVVFYADTEDYTCDYSNDGIRDIARVFEKEGVKCCFNITGYLALRIQELGRTDVIEALKPHTLGTQTLYHSRHPTPAEIADDASYERAYRRALRDESLAIGMVEGVFGEGRVVFACPPGSSISPSMIEAVSDLGVTFSAGNGWARSGTDGALVVRPGNKVDGLWYFNVYQASYHMDVNLDNFIPGNGTIAEGDRKIPDFKAELDEMAKFDFVGIGSHPNMQGHKLFWDKVNYDKKNLAPWRKWTEAERRDPEDTKQYYRNVTAFIKAIKADGRFKITNFDEMLKGVRPRVAITRENLPAVREALQRDFNCIREPASWSVADAYCASVLMLRGEKEYKPGKVYGFLARPKGVSAPTEVTAAGLRKAAEKLDLTTFIPPQIEVDGKMIGPADFLYAALDVLVTGAERVKVEPREQLGSFKEVKAIEHANIKGSWLHSPDFEDKYVTERFRLQLWTLRIDPVDWDSCTGKGHCPPLGKSGGLKYGDTGDPVFDRQLNTTDAEFNAMCEELAKKYPHLVKVGEIGRSAENRRITLLTVTDFANGGEDKPGYFVQGNIHSKELSSWSASFHIAKRLCEDHEPGGLLSKMVFYVVPRCNPDGSERMTVEPGDERSGWQKRLPADVPNQFCYKDVNGDGVISRMRVKDPKGNCVVSPLHPTCMRNYQRGKPGQQRYCVLCEGELLNWDGKHSYRDVAYTVQHLDMNRLWGPGFKGWGSAEPFSAKEVKAQADWLEAHKNLRGAMCYHNGYEMLLSHSVEKKDREKMEKLGKLGEKIMNVPYLPEDEQDEKCHAAEVVAGRFSEYCYRKLGIFCFTVELGTMENSGGASTNDLFDRPDVYEEMVEVCRMQDEHPEIPQGFMDWKPFKHPQFGDVEIGGYQGATLACALPIDVRRHANSSYRFICAWCEDILKAEQAKK